MTEGPDPATARLVPRELRGYRRFRLDRGHLWPGVYTACGPWNGRVEHAVCGKDSEHEAPHPDCGCGLYGWYHPSRASRWSGFGEVTAVIAVRGRSILAEHGFRAAGARIEAVALPAHLRWLPGAARRTGQRLTRNYPGTAVYRSRRRMLQDHPSAELRDLGIVVRPSRAAYYAHAAVVVWLLGMLVLYGLAVSAHDWVDRGGPAVWAPALAGVVLWQALIIWLAGRCGRTTRRPPDRQ